MLNRTRQTGVVVSLAAGLLAAWAACGPASASQAAPRAASMSSAGTTAQPARGPTGASLGTLSLPAGRLVRNIGPGPARKASLYYPTGVAVNARGDLFIADMDNYVVEEVTPAGRLSVVAGDGKEGTPTPGRATRSRLVGPYAVAVDAHGDLFVVDTYVVEKVTPAGRLSVVAGNGNQGPPKPGLATKSDLYQPHGVAVNAHGDLFIADEWNDVVEEVTPSGRLSVVAGVADKQGRPTPGRAARSKLYLPTAVAVDTHGDLFVSDSGNYVVEKITPAGKLSVVAGMAGRRGPPTLGPATRSELNAPYGLALDARGDLFIADPNSELVEEVTSAGRLSWVAGRGQAGPPMPGPAIASDLDGPEGVAVNAHGDLFIADTDNNLVEEVTPAGKLSVFAGIGR